MSRIVAVDPGLRACGVAVFDRELLWAGAVRGPKEGRGAPLWRAYGELVWEALDAYDSVADGVLVVEAMKVYVYGKGDPEVLLELAAIGGAVVACAPRAWPVECVKARDWNGQVTSTIRRERTRAWVEQNGWLDRVDLNTTARFQQDVWSAIGIGRWKLTGSR